MAKERMQKNTNQWHRPMNKQGGTEGDVLLFICVTCLVSHLEMSALNLLARQNTTHEKVDDSRKWSKKQQTQQKGELKIN
jgi:hypothetical protein